MGVEPPASDQMLPMDHVRAALMQPTERNGSGRGFDTMEILPGSTYRDNSTVVVIPTRGLIHYKVVQSLQGLLAPMNQKRAILFCPGDEVGHAYNRMVENVLANPELAKWKYVLTLEDDNLPPADAHIRLLEAIEAGPFDAVSGLYWTKGDYQMPMCYGDPEEFRRSGVLDFRPRQIVEAVKAGNVVECNGIAMGCSLYRMSLFREIKAPWFVSLADVVPDKGPQCFTQDLYFCERAKRAGKRFAVDCRVKVGHMDVSTGIVY